MTKVIDAALAYAARGIPVFPVNPGTKAPYGGSRGFKDAVTDERAVVALFGRYGDPGIGVATGVASKILVLDVDPRHGGLDGIEKATGSLGALPRTARVDTPSGGWHYWFRFPNDVVVRNSAGVIASGLDVRGEGGYAIAPPTSGPHGKYEWSVRAPLAEFPEEWRRATAVPDRERRSQPTATWLGMLEAGIGEGTRNASLTSFVGHLLARGVDAQLVLELGQVVNAARCRPPLRPDEVERIVESIAARELRKRRGGEQA